MNQEFVHFDAAMATSLKQVRMFCHPDLPNGVALIDLSFSGGQVFIGIEEEYDTLLCSLTRRESYVSYADQIQASFWDSVIGKSLVGAWQMTNDRGYPDAIQLRFREQPNAGAYSVIQMYGEASQIRLVETVPVRELSISTINKGNPGQ